MLRLQHHSQEGNDGGRRRGRPGEERGVFANGHPQRESHMVRKRVIWVVPVILGDRIPRCDRSLEEKNRWARAMLTLFWPWRVPADLKDHDESWVDAYDRVAHTISPEHHSIIANMNVLAECKDARDRSR
ncbi:hypothetical protein C8Q76DRAFT_626018, partial [Earliella scabrosa]